MGHSSAVGVLLLACLYVAFALETVPCQWDSGVGATFDVQALQSQSSYRVLDLFSSQDHHRYAYVFNVCANTASVPKTGPNQDSDKCEVVKGTGGEDLSGPCPGYQIATDVDECFRLGDSLNDVSWSLIDDNNPAYGVALAYGGGNSCPGGFRRELRLMFVCDDNVAALPSEEPVQENQKHACIYELYIRTAYGCPTECPIVNGHLCNGHGVCGYNSDASTAACFCTEGWGGADCATVVSSGSGLAVEEVFLIIVVLLLVSVMAAVGFMYAKLRKLRVDPDSYKGLTGKFNELGTLAS